MALKRACFSNSSEEDLLSLLDRLGLGSDLLSGSGLLGSWLLGGDSLFGWGFLGGGGLLAGRDLGHLLGDLLLGGGGFLGGSLLLHHLLGGLLWLGDLLELEGAVGANTLGLDEGSGFNALLESKSEVVATLLDAVVGDDPLLDRLSGRTVALLEVGNGLSDHDGEGGSGRSLGLGGGSWSWNHLCFCRYYQKVIVKIWGCRGFIYSPE